MQMEHPTNSSVVLQVITCSGAQIQSTILSLLVAYVMLTPLFFYVLVVGCHRWRREGLSSPFTSWSHIDVFTFNVVVLDLFNVLGTFLYFLGLVTESTSLHLAGSVLFIIFVSGQTLFHLLTCMERYLAVLHPVLYLRLKGSAGFRIRNVTIGCIWLISIFVTILMVQIRVRFSLMNTLLLSFTSVAFFFCSLSVLCALIRPGPGDQGGTRKRSDQSKQRALLTLVMISGTLFLRFMTGIITSVIQNLKPLDHTYCLTGWSTMWFFVPNSLVLPLLFLQRIGKLNICGDNLK